MTGPVAIDLLVQNAHVVTFDGARRTIADGAIAVRGTSIVDIGPTSELTSRYDPAERLFASGQIAIPGLIDAHMHTAQTMMRGLLGVVLQSGNVRRPFWLEYLVRFESSLTEEDVHLSGLLTYGSILLSGTTGFFEAGGPYPDAMGRAAVESGIRGIISKSTMDLREGVPDSMYTSTEDSIAANIGVVERWPAGRRVSGAMSLRQIMVCSPELIKAVHEEAARRGVKVHTHLLEGTEEIDFAVTTSGKRPVEYLLDLGAFTDTLHCAHSVLATPWDVAKYARYGPSACHCPLNNYSIGVPRALEMWRAGVPIGLGTDGANYGSLDMFRVAATAYTGQQHVYGMPVHTYAVLDRAEPFLMATMGSARAMGIADRAGSLEVGKAADIVLLDTDRPEAGAFLTPESFLFLAASGHDVHTVVVDGRIVVRDRELLTVDLDEVVRRARRRQPELAEQFLR